MAMSLWFQQLCGGDESIHVELVQDNAPFHRREDDVDADQTSVRSSPSCSSSTSRPSREGKHVESRWSSIPELTRMTTTAKYTKKATEPSSSRTYRSKSRCPSSLSAAEVKCDSSIAIQPPKRVPSDEFLCDSDDDDDADVPCTLTTPYGEVLAPFPADTATTTTITNSTLIGWPYDGEQDIDDSGDEFDDRWDESTIDAVESMRSSSCTPPPMPCRRYSLAT